MTATVSGINLQTVGTILLVVGIIGLIISLLYLTLWTDRRRGAVVEHDAVGRPADREVVRERY